MRDVGRYMERCDLYQQMKNKTEEVAGKLKLWTHLTVDFCNDLKLELRLHLGKDLRKCKRWIRSGKV